MDTQEISFVIRCLVVRAACLGVVGAIFTYDLLLELPFFTNFLTQLGLR